MCQVTCWRSFTGSPSDSVGPIKYRVASMVWQCQFGIAPTYLIDLCRPVSGSRSNRSLQCRVCTHREGGCSQSCSPVPAELVLSWPRRYGIASLCASYLGHFQTHSIINWKLFFLTVLESGGPLSSFLEEMLHKSLNEWKKVIRNFSIFRITCYFFGFPLEKAEITSPMTLQ